VIRVFQVVGSQTMNATQSQRTVQLPPPQADSGTSIEKSLLERRSVREYRDDEVSVQALSQLLWAGQGITDRRGCRTAPSAGALYPLEVAVAAVGVSGLAPGVYRYRPRTHELIKTVDGDRRAALWRAALEQSSILNARAVLVFCAVYDRTTRKYGERGIRYVHLEAGHAVQNVCLQAISLGLGTVVIGAFHDKEVSKVLALESEEAPLIILPVGKGRAD